MRTKIAAVLALALLAVGLIASPAAASGPDNCTSKHTGQSQDGSNIVVGGHTYHPTGWMLDDHHCNGGYIWVSMVSTSCQNGAFDAGMRIKFSNGVIGSERLVDCNDTINVQIGQTNNNALTFQFLFRTLIVGAPNHMSDALAWS